MADVMLASDSRSRRARTAFFCLTTALGLAATAPVGAQYIGGKAPPPPPPPAAGVIESPSAALSRNVRILAGSPRDFAALVAAGRAALEMGDVQTAVGFFGRAEEVRPTDPAPKVGMGAATLQTGDPREALGFFEQAERLGANGALLGADRGLANDLLGQTRNAQVDYRAALYGPTPDEARRRLALSLAISGKQDEAMATLQPLLNRRDPAAQRARAFVLALGGNRLAAHNAIEAAMPGSSNQMDPFLQLLPRLSASQKAAAVHLGVFPAPSQVELASATPVTTLQVSPPSPTRVRRAAPTTKQAAVTMPRIQPVPEPKRDMTRQVVVVRESGPARPSTSAFSGRFNQHKTVTTTVVRKATPVPAPRPVQMQVAPPTLTPSSIPAPTQQPTMEFTPAPIPAPDRLSGLERAIAQAPDPAPVIRSMPKREDSGANARKAAADKRAALAKLAADKKAAADRKLRDERAAAERKEREETARLGVAGTHWIQLAGGSNADRMATEYKRISTKAGGLLKARPGYVTMGKDYYRLLIGPFASKAEAQAFTNKLAKEGVDGFSWTRTPATIKIEKLPSR